MKNQYFKKYVIAWAILLVMFNVIVFAIPNEVAGMSKFGGAFWSGYVCIMLTFVGQLVCANLAMKAENAERFFLNLPLITLSYTSLILSIVAGTACMAIPNVPNWIGIILCVLILGFTAIAIVKASAAADLVQDTEKKVKEQTLFIKMLTADAEILMSKAQGEEAKAAAKKVYEAVRYSDPMSVEALAGMESQINLKFHEFADAVTSGAGNIDKLAEEVTVLVEERNKKCKVLK